MYRGSAPGAKPSSTGGAAPSDPVKAGMHWFKTSPASHKAALGVAVGILVRARPSHGTIFGRGLSCKQVLTAAQSLHLQLKVIGFALQMLLFMYFVIEDHDILFVLSETCHLIGLAVLLYKLHQKKSAAGAHHCLCACPRLMPDYRDARTNSCISRTARCERAIA